MRKTIAYVSLIRLVGRCIAYVWYAWEAQQCRIVPRMMKSVQMTLALLTRQMSHVELQKRVSIQMLMSTQMHVHRCTVPAMRIESR